MYFSLTLSQQYIDRTLTGMERVAKAVRRNPKITNKALISQLRSRCMSVNTIRQYAWAARRSMAA